MGLAAPLLYGMIERWQPKVERWVAGFGESMETCLRWGKVAVGGGRALFACVRLMSHVCRFLLAGGRRSWRSRLISHFVFSTPSPSPPARQRKARATAVSDLASDSIFDDVICSLNINVAQNDRLTGRNEALTEQVARNEDEIKRIRSALEISEETQAKMEERMGKMEKQNAVLVETTRRNLSLQSQINATYANVLTDPPCRPPQLPARCP